LGSKQQGGESLFDVDEVFGDADAESDFGFPFEGIREKPGDFGVSEGNVGLIEVELVGYVLIYRYNLRNC
jgi:hypothetical protein